MSGTSAGTGRPLHFQCSKCRLRKWSHSLSEPSEWTQRRGRVGHVKLTGKRRELFDGNAGCRNSEWSFQYKCHDCGHVGWSRHTDLERVWDKEMKS